MRNFLFVTLFVQILTRLGFRRINAQNLHRRFGYSICSRDLGHLKRTTAKSGLDVLVLKCWDRDVSVEPSVRKECGEDRRCHATLRRTRHLQNTGLFKKAYFSSFQSAEHKEQKPQASDYSTTRQAQPQLNYQVSKYDFAVFDRLSNILSDIVLYVHRFAKLN